MTDSDKIQSKLSECLNVVDGKYDVEMISVVIQEVVAELSNDSKSDPMA